MDSPEALGGRTDSEPERRPVEQESEQDTLIGRQRGSTGALPAASVVFAAKQGPSSGPVQRQEVCDGEEKRDQSKEEPSLEVKQQDEEQRKGDCAEARLLKY